MCQWIRGTLRTATLSAHANISQILTIWAQRPIVEKHDRYSLHLPVSEAIASMLCDLPNKILTSLLFSLAVYFMANLRRTVGAFFVFYLFSFVALLTMSMVFRLMGSLSKRIEQSMAPGAVMTINFLIYAGFVVPVPYMVPWFGWMRFINPIAYAYESLMLNEVSRSKFSIRKGRGLQTGSCRMDLTSLVQGSDDPQSEFRRVSRRSAGQMLRGHDIPHSSVTSKSVHC